MLQTTRHMDGKNEVWAPLKMYIMVPDEIAATQPVGKIMAHAAHNASIITWEHKGSQRVDEWYFTSMTKIVVRVPWNLEELRDLVQNMRERNYPAAMIDDNQIGTALCAALGPFNDEEAEYFKFTGLRLY